MFWKKIKKYSRITIGLVLNTFTNCLNAIGLDEEMLKKIEQKNNGWLPKAEASMIRAFTNSLVDSEADEPEEIDSFCNCMMTEVKKRYSMSDIMLNAATETPEYDALMDSCYFQAVKSE